MPEKKSLIRFGKSVGVGVGTFSIDLILLFFLTDVLNMYYLLSAGLAFVIATSINYFISRQYVFPGSVRSIQSGYLFFLIIGGAGLLFITLLMYLFVDIAHLHYVISRILVAGVVGWWNYLMNLYLNFKVAGK